MDQEKEVCVITGGGSGIGFAAAKRLGKKGMYRRRRESTK